MDNRTEKNGKAGGVHGQSPDLVQRGEKAYGEARARVDELTRRLDLKGRVDKNPIGMVAIAFGVGYVLGGGLFSRFTAGLVRIGLRAAALPALKYALGDHAAGVLGGALPEHPGSPHKTAL